MVQLNKFRVFVQPMGKKDPNTPNHGQTLKETKTFYSTFAFNEVPIISKSHLRVELYLLRHYSNLKKMLSSVLISKGLLNFIFSTFRAFNYDPIMVSMNYFGQVILEILENN